MRKAERDCMAPLPAVSLLVTSIQWVPRKVCARREHTKPQSHKHSAPGWTPSTFVSSRSERAKGRAARPEDFMDEEDIAEMRADFKLVDGHEQMDLLGGTQTEMNRRGDGADVEKEYVHPPTSFA